MTLPSLIQQLTQSPEPATEELNTEEGGKPSEATIAAILSAFSDVPQSNGDVQAKLTFGASTIIKGTRVLKKRGLIVKSGKRRANTDLWVVA